MQIFRKSSLTNQCERCRRVLSLSQLGVCTECREILCDAHLHGSFARRLRVHLLGAPAVCVRCRGEGVGRGA